MIVKEFKAQGANIYVKGAPECMPDICIPGSCVFHPTLIYIFLDANFYSP